MRSLEKLSKHKGIFLFEQSLVFERIYIFKEKKKKQKKKKKRIQILYKVGVVQWLVMEARDTWGKISIFLFVQDFHWFSNHLSLVNFFFKGSHVFRDCSNARKAKISLPHLWFGINTCIPLIKCERKIKCTYFHWFSFRGRSRSNQ